MERIDLNTARLALSRTRAETHINADLYGQLLDAILNSGSNAELKNVAERLMENFFETFGKKAKEIRGGQLKPQ